MKLKIWQFEYDFDRDDAKIVIPIILLLAAISVTTLNPIFLLAATAAYYLLYFFMMDAVAAVKGYVTKLKMRCPKCKNRKIILQGYETYKSDEYYAYYFCDECGTTSILTDGGLHELNKPRSVATNKF